jgi:hypothetical protein
MPAGVAGSAIIAAPASEAPALRVDNLTLCAKAGGMLCKNRQIINNTEIVFLRLRMIIGLPSAYMIIF